MSTESTATPNDPEAIPDAPIAPAGMVPITSLGELGRSIVEAIQSTTHRKQPFGQYDPRTNFHPNKKLAPKLKRECWQNDRRAAYDTLTDNEVRLLNRLTHSGRYLDRIVEVRIDEESGDNGVVYISYSNRTVDQRMRNKDYWTTFEDLLTKLVAAQEAEDAEAEAPRPKTLNKGVRK